MGCAVCDETQNLNETGSETFFRYQIFSRPVPRLFSVPNFFETGSETFFGTKFFRDRFRDYKKIKKSRGTERDRYQGPNLTQINTYIREAFFLAIIIIIIII